MSAIEAIILGIIQGLTEFLPVSSSGHIELGKAILGTEIENDLLFTLIVHLATVLSIFIVFRKDIWGLIQSLFTFKWNDGNQYIAKLVLSIVPLGFVYVFLEDKLDSLFEGNLVLVGLCLIATAGILLLSKLERKEDGKVSFKRALIIGAAQAVAILPGISRSGTTIATALALGVSRENAARFSFLMVLAPIIGASILELKDFGEISSGSSIELLPLLLGFIAAFASGLIACTWMLNIVKRGKITWFSAYCLVIGLIAVGVGLFAS